VPEDTWRYVTAARKFSKLQELMAADAGYTLVDELEYPDRLEKWSHRIDEGVANELFSLLFLIHDDEKSRAYSDWLAKHCDKQNCPHWSFLSFAWKTFFNKSIGRYVTAVFTANWKKSVSDLYNRDDVIGRSADYILEKYDATEAYLREVTVDTLCPSDSISPFKRLPLHTDPFVHLSPVIFAITRLRDFLWSKLGLRMSAYLRDEMIVSSLLETNNMFRFGMFAQVMYDAWVLHEEDPIPTGSSFADCFQVWLRTTYPSNEGSYDRRKVSEGVTRYTPSKNNPTMVSTTYTSIRSFHDVMIAARKRTVSDVEFRRTLRLLDKSIEGASDLKIQKMIYIRVTVG
jgi:hypothetical protein